MATSAEHDKGDKDETDDTDGAEAAADVKKADDEDKAPDKVAAKASTETDDEEDEDEAPRKPAPKAKPAGAKGSKRPGSSSSKGVVRGRPVTGARQASGQQGSSLGKSMILFVLIIGGLAIGFAVLGREEQQQPLKPKWTAGQTVDVEITLVKNDRAELACAAADEIGGKHCAFESQTKAWTKGDVNDDKKLLKPYTTTDRTQFTAAGVWSEPALAPDKIPASRFSLKCKYKVDGMLKNLAVRWEQTGQWFPNNDGWYAGSVSDCKIVP